MDLTSSKALKLLQNIHSLDKINKLVLPVNESHKNEEAYDFVEVADYYSHIYEECVAILLELSVIMRREAEKLALCGLSINAKVKFSNVGKYKDSATDVSFYDTLSKIIHSTQIDFEVQSPKGQIAVGYELGKNCKFTGSAIIHSTEKDNITPCIIKIDVSKFCVNVFMLTAEEYSML